MCGRSRYARRRMPALVILACGHVLTTPRLQVPAASQKQPARTFMPLSRWLASPDPLDCHFFSPPDH
jgi:hypothetical protein